MVARHIQWDCGVEDRVGLEVTTVGGYVQMSEPGGAGFAWMDRMDRSF